MGESLLLGNLQKGSIDLTGAVVEIQNSNIPNLEAIIRIQSPSKIVPFEVAVETREEVWKKNILPYTISFYPTTVINFQILITPLNISLSY